jgi:hypothetical protein
MIRGERCRCSAITTSRCICVESSFSATIAANNAVPQLLTTQLHSRQQQLQHSSQFLQLAQCCHFFWDLGQAAAIKHPTWQAAAKKPNAQCTLSSAAADSTYATASRRATTGAEVTFTQLRQTPETPLPVHLVPSF